MDETPEDQKEKLTEEEWDAAYGPRYSVNDLLGAFAGMGMTFTDKFVMDFFEVLNPLEVSTNE